MSTLTLVHVGPLLEDSTSGLTDFLTNATGLACRWSMENIDPEPAYTPSRGQFDTRKLLPELERIGGRDDARAVGLTAVDLFSAVFTFVFGEAKLGGHAAIVSTHRLHPEVYGLPNDPALVRMRVRKEVLHETGHLLGLVHCRDPQCVMRFSAVVEEIDIKSDRLCAACQAQLV